MRRQPVEETYVDALGERRRTNPAVRAAITAAMGSAAGDGPTPLVVRPGGPIAEPGEVVLEDGTALGRIAAMPRDAPPGYHRLVAADGSSRLLITGPGRCHLPPGLREWGWAIQLATTRSKRSWGIGDLADLRALSVWAAGDGAGFLLVSPLGAPNPGPRTEPSPYYPSTRRFGSPLHLSVERAPGASLVADELAPLAAAAHALNAEPRVDRARVLELKRAALERVWSGGAERDAFRSWRVRQDSALERWAVFSVLSEKFGPGWQSWPAGYRDPARHEVAEVAAADAERVSFHAWLQWCWDRQLADAAAPLRRVADMPIGVDPGGFDAWDWQAQLAMRVWIGAPPDRFNSGGQNWGLPPFIPHRLREAGYRPFIETIRAQLRHAGGLRIDHVLGLFRLWWIPRGSGDGAYVSYPTDELLEIVAIESHRAHAIIIGEDLGTVPRGVRAELRRRRVLSTRLALFERQPPAAYPRGVLAAVTTHDLPTVAGAWSGSDLADQKASGVRADPRALAHLRGRIENAAGVPPDAPLALVTAALHQRLGASPAVMVAATLEDALRVEERVNMPGTVPPRRHNWSTALPVPIEDLAGDAGVASVVGALREGRGLRQRPDEG